MKKKMRVRWAERAKRQFARWGFCYLLNFFPIITFCTKVTPPPALSAFLTLLFFQSRPLSQTLAWLFHVCPLFEKELQSIKLNLHVLKAPFGDPGQLLCCKPYWIPQAFYRVGTALNLYSVKHNCCTVIPRLHGTH